MTFRVDWPGKQGPDGGDARPWAFFVDGVAYVDHTLGDRYRAQGLAVRLVPSSEVPSAYRAKAARQRAEWHADHGRPTLVA
ncbi:hypothetical protein [Phytohabitans rumicis]|uniref:Uncharacterized protein n=1 Tax=Phytohabitans rumicis TaxID=1076125 RepID=A0A6V8L352_9ACTN|nr:hypothetical protein [Phytohabitans rumicis]GFJ91702.1 hypothetical protein Prum_053440 [Phytohabitans rumicis]